MVRLGLLLALLIAFVFAGQQQAPARQLPPPTDIDPQLTEELRRVEQNLSNAILHRDAEALDRLVGPEYTLRLSDAPQASVPRANWMANTLNRVKAESVDLRDCTARKLADDLAVVSLLHDHKATIDGRNFSGVFYLVDFWKKRDGTWQIIARYSSPVGHEVERGNRPLPPPADVDPELTAVLRALEEELGQAALGGYKDTATMERVVGSEFTQRVSDAPQRSLSRAMWGQPSGTYTIESLEQRYYAARKLAEDFAALSFLLTQKASREGQDRSGDFYVVDIWKKRGDRWQLIARYSSPLGKTFDRMRP
jgi:Domain of unknown function (DUF4440)